MLNHLTQAFVCLSSFVLSKSEILYSQPSIQSFSGSNYGGSTGWIYETTIDSSTQWGRLYYRMDPIDTNGDNYVHVTFVAIQNGKGLYEYTDGSSQETDQVLRIVDSVGYTQYMRNTPYESVQYLLNIDTQGNDGELNIDTQYIYYYDTNWTCMEWYTNSDEQDIQLYENGILTYEVDNGIEFTGSNSGATITFTFEQSLNLGIGMYTYNGVYVSGDISGIQISDERIGCNGIGTDGDQQTDMMTTGSGTDAGNGGNNNNNGMRTSHGLRNIIMAFMAVVSVLRIFI